MLSLGRSYNYLRNNGILLIRKNIENCNWIKCVVEIISVFNLGCEKSETTYTNVFLVLHFLLKGITHP